MSNLISNPTNPKFYYKYVDLIKPLQTVASISQILTGICEISILFSIFSSSVAEIAPAILVKPISLIGAVICASMLQIGIRVCFPYLVKAIIYKEKSYGYGVVLNVFVTFLTLVLLSCSITLSFRGSKELNTISDTVAAVPDNSILNANLELNKNALIADSILIEQKFGFKIMAVSSSKIKNSAKANKIADIIEIRKIYSRKSDSIKNSFNEFLNNSYVKTSDKVKSSQLKSERYGNYLGLFCITCYLFFLSIYTLNEIFKVGSGIKNKRNPKNNKKNNKETLLNEFFEEVKRQINFKLRNKLDAFKNNNQPNKVNKLEVKRKPTEKILEIGFKKSVGKGSHWAVKREAKLAAAKNN